MQFTTLIENQTGPRIKAIVNDNGGEYTPKAFRKFITEHGIRIHLTAPYTPQQNPVAERGNTTTVKKARAMLKQAGLPSEFWAEAVLTAVYLENGTPIASKGFKSPYELWKGKAPKYSHLRVFGCLAYVHVEKARRAGKFSDTAVRGVFLGYQEGHHNYPVMLFDTRRIVYSHDVSFDEGCFPLNDSHPTFSDAGEVEFKDNLLTVETTPASSPTSPEEVSNKDEAASQYLSDEGSRSTDKLPLDPHPSSSTRAPKDILSAIEESNILPNRTRRTPQTYANIKKPMNSTSPDP